MTNPYRQLPALAALLERPELVSVRATAGRDDVANALRTELETLRQRIAAGESPDGDLDPERIVERARISVERDSRAILRTVINATGIVLHTNLGRSPLPESAARAAFEAASGYLNLELDLETGERSSRQDPIRDGIRRLTGAEAATAVNNCAAATVIALRALAAGKEVVVSRGQLVEIGGGFRIPEILAVSGARLREVGTTNRTRIADYEKAIGPETGAILRVHASNFRIRGFTESVGIADLAALGRRHGLPVIDDIGSGAAVDLDLFASSGEPRVGDGIRAGADLVLFSGDKLLGGPQAGIVAGRKELIARIEKDPLMRAFRLDKMTLAALEATLRLYRDPERALRDVPTLRMLTVSLAELRTRAERIAERLRSVPGLDASALDDEAFAGGGSLPDRALPTVVVAMKAQGLSEDEMARRLRTGRPAVLARIQDGSVRLDPRTVFEHQEDELVSAVRSAVAGSP